MDEDQHRKEIESLIPLITKRINHYEQDGLSMSFGSAEQYVMAREIIRLREANERLRKRFEDKENCACWVEYDYRCPVHGEQSE